MAVTVRNYNLNAFWNSDDLLTTLETALADVGYHAPTQSGTILTFTNSAGTTIASKKGIRYLVKQDSTSGSGANATFDIVRNQATGAIGTVTLVNGGDGYAGTNTITVKGYQIGGANTTDDLTITVSTVSGAQGSTTTWYDKDTSSPYTWGVCCVDFDRSKKMGQTFYSFYIAANPTILPTIYVRAGAGWQSATNVFNGVAGLDYYSTNVPNSTTQHSFQQTIASSFAVPLTLTTYQSGIDPNFVVFQFSEAGSKYGKLYRWPFFLSKYNSATQPWNLDDFFLGGIYEIIKAQTSTTTEAAIATQIRLATAGKRQAEWGYNGTQGTYANAGALTGYYESLYGKRNNTGAFNSLYPVIYQRTDIDYIQLGPEYNPVITGIPINNLMIPCPYFMPADFGITEVIAANSIEYGDLIGVGATTKWKVLQYGNNQNLATYNGAIAFVAKTVD